MLRSNITIAELDHPCLVKIEEDDRLYQYLCKVVVDSSQCGAFPTLKPPNICSSFF